MKKGNYQELKLEITLIYSQDVITASTEVVETDNMGEWKWEGFAG